MRGFQYRMMGNQNDGIPARANESAEGILFCRGLPAALRAGIREDNADGVHYAKGKQIAQQISEEIGKLPQQSRCIPFAVTCCKLRLPVEITCP